MTHVTCRLTAKNRDQRRNPTLGNRVRATFTFFTRRRGCYPHLVSLEYETGNNSSTAVQPRWAETISGRRGLLPEAAPATSSADDNNDGCHDDEDEYSEGRDRGIQRPLDSVRIAACQSNQHTRARGHHRANELLTYLEELGRPVLTNPNRVRFQNS